MTSKQREFMMLAIKLAEENVNSGKGSPFGSVIVRNNQIIAATANTVTATNDPTAHAEIAAIRIACEKLKTSNLEGCEIYASCEPCPMCLGAIYWTKIDKIYYAATKEDAAQSGFDDSFLYHAISTTPEQRAVKTEHILHREALSAFRMWQKKSVKE